MIYLDHAATSFHKPEAVYEAVLAALKTSGNADRGGNPASLTSTRILYQARCALANLFGAEDASRIAFTSNATESLNIAIKGILTPGDHVITTVLEHNSILRPLYELEKKGLQVSFAGCDRKGRPDYEEMERLVRDDTRAILVTHASNLTGNVVDLKKVSKIAKEKGILLLVDASQTAGVLPIDVQKTGIDILCFTGHKSLFGPQGTGGIYVRPGLSIRPLKTGGSGIRTFEKEHPKEMPTALEAGTLNTPGIAGLSAGVSFILETTPEQIHKRETELMRRFYEGIQTLPQVEIYGDFETSVRCPIVSLNIKGYDSALVGDCLSEEYGIAVRTGGHCAPKMHEALGTVKTGAVRFSFSYFNTEEDVDAAILAIREIATEEE